MPIHKGKSIAADDAFALGLCPETGKPLDDIEDIDGHIRDLWPGEKSPEAQRRIDMLRKHARSK